MSEVLSPDLQVWSAPRQQTVFRHLMRAFSFPGRVEAVAHADALTQTLATLVDRETTLADPHNLLDALTLQRLQARITAPERRRVRITSAR